MTQIKLLFICSLIHYLVLPCCCKNYLTDGYEYVFAIPQLANPSDPPRVLIATPSWTPVNATLTILGIGFNVDTSVSRYQHADITLPTSARLDYGTGKRNETIIVRSSDSLSVYAFDNEYFSGDGFVILSSSQLGTRYGVSSYTPYSNVYPSFFCMTTLDEETVVEITTKAGKELTIILEPYQSFRFDGQDKEDLTGTSIVADRPISVISGVWTDVPEDNCCGDALLEMLPPEHNWGKHFVLAPFIGLSNGYVYRILATDEDTTLAISNIGLLHLKGHEWYEGHVTDNTMISITSDKSILVTQYIKGRGGGSGTDPSMIIVPPVESFGNNFTFAVLQMTYGGTFDYNINVIIACSDIDALVYDDNSSMVDWDLLRTNDNATCAIQGPIPVGTHSVTNSDPLAAFAVIVYGIHGSSSYAYPTGFVFPPYTPPVSTQPPFDEAPVDVIGLNLHCDGTNMTAIFNSSVVPYTQASDVHMLDANCVASEYGVDQAIISTNYRECQTKIKESDGYIVFRNALIGAADPDSPIIQHYVNIECRIERRHMADTSYLSNLKTHVSYGNFSFELAIYPDVTYSAPYNSEDYPIDVKVGDNLYMAANVITVNELDLFVDSCWATPTADPWLDTSYTLILNGCADDGTLVFYDSEELRTERFSFHAFGFKGDNWLVFVHCQLVVCDSNTSNSRCAQGCIEEPNDNSSRMRRSTSDLRMVSSRPIVVRG